METSVPFLIVMAISVTILGLSKGGFAGVGMVSTPIVALVSDPVTAVGLILPIMLVQDVVSVYIYREDFNGAILRRLIPGGAVGVLIAYFTASFVSEWGVHVLLGVISVLFSIWQIAVYLRGVPALAVSKGKDRVAGVAAGVASGFSSAIAHAGSPPFQIYVMPKRLRKEVYAGTSATFFAVLNLMKLPSFVALGLFDNETLQISAVFVPLAIISSWAGARLVRIFNPHAFDLVVVSILLAVGLGLIVQGVALR